MCMRYDHKATLRMRKRGVFKAWKVASKCIDVLIAPCRYFTYDYGMQEASINSGCMGFSKHSDGHEVEACGFHVFLQRKDAVRWACAGYDRVVPVYVRGRDAVCVGMQEMDNYPIRAKAASFKRMRILKRDYDKAIKGK